MSRPSLLARTLAVVGGLLLIGAAPAAAEPGVVSLPPLDTQATLAPQLASDAAGVTYAAWPRSIGGPIRWAQHAYGAQAFGPAQDVAPSIDPDESAATFEDGPLIAADGAGNVTVAWTSESSLGVSLLAATKLAGASGFGAPVRITRPGDIARSIQLFTGDDGSTTLTWVDGVDTFHQRVAIRTSPTGAFGAPTDVYADGGIADEVAGGRDGTVAFGRTQSIAGPPAQNVATVVRKGRGAATLDAPIELLRGDAKEIQPSDRTRVAVSDTGLTWASSIRWAGNSGTPGLWAAAAGQAFTNRCQLNFGTTTLVGVDAGGAWLEADTATGLSRTTVCAPNRRVLSPLAAGIDVTTLALSPDAAGGAHLTWTERTGGDPSTARIRSVYQQVGCLQSFIPEAPVRECDEFGFNVDPVRTVATDGAFASDAAPERDGNLVVAYSRADDVPRAAIVDREIPQIAGVTVEQGATPLAVRLSATASDTYSPPVTYTWTVSRPGTNDRPIRQTVEGPSAEVTVPAPPAGISVRGTVFLRVRDAAGNTAVLSRSLPNLPPTPTPTPTPQLGTLSAKLGATRFRPVTSGGAVDAAPASAGRGAALTITTTTAARATLTLAARVTGRRRGATCSRTARRGKRCATYAPLRGSEQVSLPAGTTTLRLTGRWGGRALRPGRYRLTIRVPDVPAPVVLAFRIR